MRMQKLGKRTFRTIMSHSFNKFYGLIIGCIALFYLVNFLITNTDIVSRIPNAQNVLLIGGLLLVAVAIGFGIKFLKNEKKPEVTEVPGNPAASWMNKITGWKAVVLFFGFFALFFIAVIIWGVHPKQ